MTTLKNRWLFTRKASDGKSPTKVWMIWPCFPWAGMTLALYPRQALAEDATLQYQPSQFPGLSFSYNAKSEKEVDDILKQVATLGATLIKPAQKVFWGGYSGYFKDLDGHLFEVAFNPFWEFDENDNLKL